eukprot:CAMPEP_0197035252 /NCGR_PEP_ID=MMETSP1384-20130603/13107_1 /TAXON_ID=29189 /ORGANISM="Ammonia sp." /LENGTH=581 /DNA_ID=CAMNT_0042465295 /DNA_START=1 /DNA_END=1746 /DNA_ORIENTATION=+
MQQSFGTQVVQSNLTDCSQRNTDTEELEIDDANGCGSPASDDLDVDANSPAQVSKLSLRDRLIPLLVFVPLLLLIFVLFIWAFIITAAWLHIMLHITAPYAPDVDIYSMDSKSYDLSIQNSIDDLWHSKSYGIAILVLLLSFIFPLLKLLYILFLTLSHAFRDHALCIKYTPRRLQPNSGVHRIILIVLEILNKYSFINIFILVILMSSLYINIDDNVAMQQAFSKYVPSGFVPSGSASASHVQSVIVIEPDRGIVVFGVAMILTSLLTIMVREKYVTIFHAQAPSLARILSLGKFGQEQKEMEEEAMLKRKKFDEQGAEYDEARARAHRYGEGQSPLLFSKNYSFRSFCLKMVTFLFFIFMVIGAVCLIIAQLPFLEVEYGGDLAEYMTQPPAQRVYSMDGIVESIEAENNNGKTKFLRVIYEIFVIVFPLITILLLIMLWLIPMPKWVHDRLKDFIWSTHLLNAIDVVVISSVLVQQELPSTFKYIVQHQYADYCASLQKHFGSDLCGSLDLKIYLRDGVWIAIAFYISMWIVVVYSVHFSVDTYSEKQRRKLKIKIKKMERKGAGENVFKTIDENKTL